MSIKTIKFATKRLRLTKKGKVMFRPNRQNHFNAKTTGNQKQHKRGTKNLAKATADVFKKILER